jgi:large subunit ribosomal protein L16
MKRKGSMWIRIFPQKSVTKKPLEVRMGKGKANVDHWVAVVRPATMLFEVEGVPESVAREALSSAAAKMPVRCRFAERD